MFVWFANGVNCLEEWHSFTGKNGIVWTMGLSVWSMELNVWSMEIYEDTMDYEDTDVGR